MLIASSSHIWLRLGNAEKIVEIFPGQYEVKRMWEPGSFFGHDTLSDEASGKNERHGARSFTNCQLYLLLERDIAYASLRHELLGKKLIESIKVRLYLSSNTTGRDFEFVVCLAGSDPS